MELPRVGEPPFEVDIAQLGNQFIYKPSLFEILDRGRAAATDDCGGVDWVLASVPGLV